MAIPGCGRPQCYPGRKKEGFGVFLGIPRESGLVEEKLPRETEAGAGSGPEGVCGAPIPPGWFCNQLTPIFLAKWMWSEQPSERAQCLGGGCSAPYKPWGDPPAAPTSTHAEPAPHAPGMGPAKPPPSIPEHLSLQCPQLCLCVGPT